MTCGIRLLATFVTYSRTYAARGHDFARTNGLPMFDDGDIVASCYKDSSSRCDFAYYEDVDG